MTVLRNAMTAIDPALAERLGWVLLHFLWQGAAVAAGLTIALSLARRSPAVRYRLACLALAAMAAAPVVTFRLLRPVAAGTGGGAVSFARPLPAVPMNDPLPENMTAADVPVVRDHPALTTPRPPAWTWVVLAWGGGVAALSVWRVGGWVYLRGLIRRTRRADAAWEVRLADLRQKLRVSRPVRLAEAAWVQVPAVVGVFRPVILLPAAALTGLTPEQIEALLAHELAHVRRGDYLVNLLQSAAETVLFYHPAVWWVSARIREEREHCCDDLAAAACGDPSRYARALAAMEGLRALPAHLALAARGGALLPRVRRLLGIEAPRRRGRPLLAAVLAAACALFPLAAARLSAQAKPPTTSPTTQPVSTSPAREPAGTEIRPDDLVAEKGDYRISPLDELKIEISDIQGVGTNTVKNVRVSETGKISLPRIGDYYAAGQSELALEKEIIREYRNWKIINNPIVSVTITEPRGRMFGIRGAVARPGSYTIPKADFRLLDALVLAGDVTATATDDAFVIRSARGEPDEPAREPRRINVPLRRLTAGDLRLNLVVRPGDMIVIQAAEARPLRLTVGLNGLTLDGKPTSWQALGAMLETIPEADRRHLTLTLSAASEEMTLRQYAEARQLAAVLVVQYKLAGLNDVGLNPPAPPTTLPTTTPRR